MTNTDLLWICAGGVFLLAGQVLTTSDFLRPDN
jgi:hypothetical protein